MKRIQGSRTAVAHAAAEAARELVQDIGHGTFVRNAGHHAFRDQLFGAFLEVTVCAAILHGVYTAHAAVAFHLDAVHFHHLAGGFVGTGKHAAAHDAVRAGGQGLHHVAGVAQTAVGNDGNAVAGHIGHIGNGGKLRNAHARDDARGADGTGADTHLEAVCAGGDEVFGGCGRGDVAHHYVQAREGRLDGLQRVNHALGMPVGAVQHYGVYTGIGQELHAVQDVRGDAHAGGHREAFGLDLGNLCGLLLRAHVLVDDANAAFAGHRKGHGGFRDGIHCRGGKGNAQRNVFGESALEGHLTREDLGIGRHQKDVVEGNAFLENTVM